MDAQPKRIALNLRNLFVKIPKTTPAVYYPVDSIGETVNSTNLVLYSLFAEGITSAFDLDESVRGIFLIGDDVWPLAFNENNDTVSLQCHGEADYSFTMQTDQDLQVTMRRNGSDENLDTAQLEDFEGNDKDKLRFLHTAFHSKYEEELVTATCLHPYKRDGLCGSFCILKKECKKDVKCKKCRWFLGLKCG